MPTKEKTDTEKKTIYGLIVEDNPADVEFIEEILENHGEAHLRLLSANRLSEAGSMLSKNPFDVVFLDLGLPDSQGLSTLHALQNENPEIPVVVLTGQDDLGLANAAIRNGAQDYLVKGKTNADLLVRSARYAIERKKSHETIRENREILRATLESSLDGILVVLAEGRVTHYNSRFAELWDAPDYILDTMDETVFFQHLACKLEMPEHCLATTEEVRGSCDVIEDIIRLKDGRALERRSSPLILDGQPKGRVWVFRDITE